MRSLKTDSGDPDLACVLTPRNAANWVHRVLVRDPDGYPHSRVKPTRAHNLVRRGTAILWCEEPQSPYHGEDSVWEGVEVPWSAHEPYFHQRFLPRCVVTGGSEFLTRHHVIPECIAHSWGHKFDLLLHDVLLIRFHDHERYERHAMRHKLHILDEYGSYANYVRANGTAAVAREWRSHFIHYAEPRFLPDLWSIYGPGIGYTAP